MARLGRNEYKIQTLLKPKRITAAVVTFVPHDLGYFQDRLEVIKLSLMSLVKHADLPIDLMVFDNASFFPVVEYLKSLKDKQIIDYLILSSTNIGLPGAYNIIAGAAPGEIIAFANEDVFYFPHWLSEQIAIIDTFPDVGLVSGFYLRGTSPIMADLARQKNLNVRIAQAPDQWIEEFCRDASYTSPQSYYEAQKVQGWTDLQDRLIEYDGKQAYAGGVCWQAVFKKEVLKKVLPNEDPIEKGHNSFDAYLHSEIINKSYLRLSTPKRLVRHIGNVITPEYKSLAEKYGLNAKQTINRDSSYEKNYFLKRGSIVRNFAIKLHNRLYNQLVK